MRARGWVSLAGEMLALLGVDLPLTAPTIMPSRSPCCFSNRPETEALWKSSQRSPNTSTNESEGGPGSQYFLKRLSMSLRKLKCGQAATPSSRTQRTLRKALLSQTSEKVLLRPPVLLPFCLTWSTQPSHPGNGRHAKLAPASEKERDADTPSSGQLPGQRRRCILLGGWLIPWKGVGCRLAHAQ